MGAFANGYAYRKKITFDYTKVSGSGSLTDYIALVSHTDVDLKSVANGGKVVLNASRLDVRYETMANVQIPHDNEDYSPTTGMIVSWLKIPSLSGTVNTEIWMYYGKSLSANEEAPTTVYSAYDSVVYMNGTGTGGETEKTDNQAWAATNSSSSITGQISTGRRFVRASNNGIYKNNAAKYRLTQNMTLSAWVRFTALPPNTEPASIYSLTGAGGNSGAFRLDNNAGVYRLNVVKYTVIDQQVNWTPATNTWYHVVAVQSGSAVTFYVNGTSIGSFSNASAFPANTSDPVRIGQEQIRAYGTTLDIDNFRKRTHQATAALIATEYANQSSPSTFYGLGSEETPPPAIPNETLHAHTVDAVAVTQKHFLATADSLHAHSVEALILTQKHLLTPAETYHTHIADIASIIEHKTLVVNDTIHAHLADEAVVAGNLLMADEATHGHFVDNIALLQKHILGVDDATHASLADNIGLNQKHILVPAETLHGQYVDSIVFTQRHVVTALDALHAQLVDNVSLSQRQLLALQDALHGHVADSPYVFTLIPLTVESTLHGHSVDATLVQVWRKRKPNSHYPSRENARIIIVEDDPYLSVDPASRAKPRGAGVVGMKPSIVERKSLSRMKDFPR